MESKTEPMGVIAFAYAIMTSVFLSEPEWLEKLQDLSIENRVMLILDTIEPLKKDLEKIEADSISKDLIRNAIKNITEPIH